MYFYKEQYNKPAGKISVSKFFLEVIEKIKGQSLGGQSPDGQCPEDQRPENHWPRAGKKVLKRTADAHLNITLSPTSYSLSS